MGRPKEAEVVTVVEQLMSPDGVAIFYFRKVLLDIRNQVDNWQRLPSKVVVYFDHGGIDGGRFDKDKVTRGWKKDIESIFTTRSGTIELEVKQVEGGSSDWSKGTRTGKAGETSLQATTSMDKSSGLTLVILFILAESKEVTSAYWVAERLVRQLEIIVSSLEQVDTKNTAFYFGANRSISLELPFQIKVRQGLSLDFKRISAHLVNVNTANNVECGFLSSCAEEQAPFLPAFGNVDWVKRIKENPVGQIAFWHFNEKEDGEKVLRLRSLMYVDTLDVESTRVTLVTLSSDSKFDFELVRNWLRMTELEREGNRNTPTKVEILGLNCKDTDLKKLKSEFNISTELTFSDHSRAHMCIPCPITLQGKGTSALESAKRIVELYANENGKPNLVDLAYTTLRTHREEIELPTSRLAIVASNCSDLSMRLNDPARHFVNTNTLVPSPRIAFLFSGLGTGHLKMGKELFDTFPTFAQHLTNFHHYLLSEYEIPLLNIMFSEKVIPESNLLTDPVISQVVLYAYGLSLAWLWGSWGVVPDVVVGHSLGETLACVLSGMLSPTQGLDLLVLRGRLLKANGPEGTLLAVRTSAQHLQSLLSQFQEQSGQSLEIVGLNSPAQTVVGGTWEEVEAFSQFCKSHSLTYKRLEVSRSYHSKILASSVANLAAEYENFHKTYISTQRSALSPKFISSLPLPNRLLNLVDLSHWQSVVSVEVDWIGAMEVLVKEEPELKIFLEIGPKPTLVSLTEECTTSQGGHVFIPSIAKVASPVESILEAVVGLWVKGVGIDLEGVLGSYAGKANLLNELQRSMLSAEQGVKETQLESSDHPDRSFESIVQIVELSVCEALGLKKGEIDRDSLVGSFGINSALALQIKNDIEARLGSLLRFPPTLLFDSPSINSTARSIESRFAVSGKPEKFHYKKCSQGENEKIAIVSEALRLPNGVSSPESYWDVLCEPTDLSTEIPLSRFNYDDYYSEGERGAGKLNTKFGCFLDDSDFEKFDSEFFGLSGREVETLDPQQRMLLECTWEGLERAGIKPSSLWESKTGIFIGLCHTDFLQVLEAYGPGSSSGSLYVATGNYPSTASGRLSWLLRSRGPSLTVDTACSSSLSAFNLACQSLLNGESDIAIVGGVNLILSPNTFLRYADGRMLSVDGHCKTWDESANGYVRGEGCGVVVLRRLDDALANGNPINAVVRATLMNSDGPAASLTTPNTHSQQKLIRDTLAKTGLQPDDIGYLEIHGTGTKLGDAQEYTTLKSVFGSSQNSKRTSPLIVGSSKTCTGHLEPASGIMALIKTSLCLQKKQVSVHQNFLKLNSHIDDTSFFVLPTKSEPMDWSCEPGSTRVAGINNFGSSGTNVHVILEEWVEKRELAPLCLDLSSGSGHGLVTLSSKSQASLKQLVESWKYYLRNEMSSAEQMLSAALTSNFGRDHYKHRAVAQLGQDGVLDWHFGTGTRLPVVFKFGPDNFDPDFEFLRSLYSQFKSFAYIVNTIEHEAQKCFDLEFSFLRLVLGTTMSSKISTVYKKYFNFCSQVAIGRFLILIGLSPDALIVDSNNSEDNYDVVCKVVSKSLDLQTGFLLLQNPRTSVNEASGIPIIHSKDNHADLLPICGTQALVLSISSVGTISSEICSNGSLKNSSPPIEPKAKYISCFWDIIGQAYINGQSIDFSMLYDDKDGVVFDGKAPTYQFNRLNYPIAKFPTPNNSSKAQLTPALPPKDSPVIVDAPKIRPLYTVQWVEDELPISTCDEFKDGWLILNFGESLVSFGERICEAVGGELDEGVNGISNNKFSNIVLILDNSTSTECTTMELQDYQSKLFQFLFQALQANCDRKLKSFTLLTHGMIDGSNPFVSTLSGNLGVYRREYPETRIQHIDFDRDDEKEEEDDNLEGIVALVKDEFMSNSTTDYCIHYSKTLKRSVQRLLPMSSEVLLQTFPEDESIFDHEKIYIVTGGLGGIGSALTSWILENGGGQVWVLARKNPPDLNNDAYNRFKDRVKYFKCNVGNYDEVKDVFESLRHHSAAGLSLGGIFHAAGALAPKLFQETVWADFENMFETKVYGAWNLHLCTLEYCEALDHFVLLSSIASVFQLQGLSAYASGNSFLNSLAEYRGALGLAGQSLLLSHIDAGLGKSLDRKKNGPGFAQLIDRMGIDELFEVLPQALVISDERKIVIGNFNWSEYSKVSPKMSRDPLFHSILEKVVSVPLSKPEIMSHGPLDQTVYSVEAIREFLTDTLIDVGKFYKSSTGIDGSEGFGNMGLDSLMLMEFRDLIDEKFGQVVPISSTITFNYPTLATLSTQVHDLILASVKQVEPTKEELPLGIPQIVDEIGNQVSIIGMSCRFGGAEMVDEYWELMLNGQSGIQPTPRSRYSMDDYFDSDPRAVGKMYCSAGGYIQDVDNFDSTFFGITPREAAVLDPQHRLALEEMWHALESAGIPPNSLRETKTGIFLGISGSDYHDLMSPHVESSLSSNPSFLTGTYTAAASGRLAHFLGTLGPAISVDTACSSSLVALSLGVQSLKSGETDLVLVGGVNLALSPKTSLVICKAGMLSPDNVCWTFDKRANGYVRGEGIGWVVLRRLGEAEKQGNRILGIVRGIASNSDGASSTLTTPNAVSQKNLIQDALRGSHLSPNDIEYIEAHGSATRIGDAIELQTLNQLAASRSTSNPLWIGCAKVNVGHTEVAAGMAGLIKVLLQLQHDIIPPHRNFTTLNPLIANPSPNMKIPQGPIKWPRTVQSEASRRRAGISCFGFSGTNVFAIIEEYVPTKAVQAQELSLRPTDVFTLSAKSEFSLEKQISNSESLLSLANCEKKVRDISFTMNVGRSHLSPYRIALTYSSKEELVNKLKARNYEIIRNSIQDSVYQLTLFFSNTFEKSSHALEHYKDLYFGYSVYRSRVDELLVLVCKLTNLKLDPSKLFDKTDRDLIEFRMFILEFAWVEILLFLLGIEVPYRVVSNGGPLGHVLAGLFSKSLQLDDAIKMLHQFIRFPSKVLNYISKLKAVKPACKLISRISGTVETISGADYWEEAFSSSSARNELNPLTFESSADSIKSIFLEFGSDSLLTSQIKPKLRSSASFHNIGASVPDNESKCALWTSMTNLISNLYAQGWSGINWSGYYEGSKLEISDSAPMYPFEKVRHYFDMDPSYIARLQIEPTVTNPLEIILEDERAAGSAAEAIAQSPLKLYNFTSDEIRSIVISCVSQVTGYPESSLEPTQGFFEMGINSQMALEVREHLIAALSETSPDEGGDSESSKSFELPAVILLDYPNINLLSRYLYSLVVVGDKVVTTFDSSLETKKRSKSVFKMSPISHITEAYAAGNEIAVVAMSCNFPDSPSLKDFWSVLCSPTDVSAPVSKDRFDPSPYLAQGSMYTANACWLSEIDLFDPEFFGMSTKEAVCLDPQQRLLLECVWSALESGSISPSSLSGSKTGVYVGITNNDYAELLRKNPSIYKATGNSFSTASGRISYILGLHGPSISIDTACSSSLVSAHYGILDLLARKTDLAIVGGVNLCLVPGPFVELCQGQMLSREGHCKTWDIGADGYVRGEGAGVVVLKRLSDCIPGRDDVIGIVKSSVVNQDGPSSSLTTPNGLAQIELMRSGLAEAGLSAEDVSYLEIHGTGTTLGDSQEAGAVSAVYSPYHSPQNPLIIGTAKTSIGHLESAAGVAGLIKILLSLQKRTIPPHKNMTTFNPSITQTDCFQLPSAPQEWEAGSGKLLRAGINSFGFSGTNAHMIIEEAGTEFKIPEENLSLVQDMLPSNLLTLSARTEKGLQSLIKAWSKYLGSQVSHTSFPHVCYTSSVGRSHCRYRLALTCKNLEDCSAQLESVLSDTNSITAPVSRSLNNTPKIVFLFTGQGAVYSGMCSELYNTHTGFRTAVDDCAAWLDKRIPVSLSTLLWDPTFESILKSNEYSQIATFVIEYSLASMWVGLGVRPKSVIGHSIGEYAAAVVAGVMDLNTALELVLSRGKLMSSLGSEGGMIAVGGSESGVKSLLEQFDSSGRNGGLEFAGFNSPKQTVLAGPAKAIETFEKFCKKQRVRAKVLEVSKPFHSSGMIKASQAFEEVCTGFKFNAPDPAVKFFSTSLGVKITDFSPSYWSAQIVKPVRFLSALQNTLRTFKPDETVVFLELGPHGVLAPNVPLCIPELSAKPVTLVSVRKEERNWTSVLKVVQSLWSLGTSVDFERLYQGLSGEGGLVRAFNLPPSPLNKRRIWIDDPKPEPEFSRIPMTPMTAIQGVRAVDSENKGIVKYHVPVQQLFSERSYLSHHMVYDSVLFPGVGFILLMIEVGKDVYNRERTVRLDNISLQAPLIYDPKTSLSNSLSTAAELDSKWLEISSSNGSNWTTNARGHWAMDGLTSSPQTIPLEQVQRRCSRNIQSSDFYKFCHKNGFNYGLDFQTIQNLWLGENEGLSSISLPIHNSTENSLTYHPVVLDGVFQTVILVQFQQALAACDGNLDEAIQLESDPYLPFTIDSFTLFTDRVPSALFAHVKWECDATGSQETIVAEVSLIDGENGLVIGCINGFQAKRVSRSRLEASLSRNGQSEKSEKVTEELLDPQNLVYTEEWVKDMAIQFKDLQVDYLRDTHIPSFMTQPDIAAELDAENIVFPWLEDLSLAYLVQVVQALFIPKGLLDSTSIQDFISSAFPRLSPHLKILIEFILGVLLKHGALSLENSRFFFESSGLSHLLNQEWQDTTVQTIRKSYPLYVSTLDLIWRCGTELSNVFLGTSDPLELLFPADGSEYEHISAGAQYNTCPQMTMSNSAIRSLLQYVITNCSQDGEGSLRILEIGAGTGGSTRHVLRTLAAFPKLKYNYTYTDISKFFFGPASTFCEELKGPGGTVIFRTLNIESEPKDQGYEDHCYDLILATNVLHATKDISKTLANVRRLLVPNGLLICCEGTRPFLGLDVTFGLVDGWWRFWGEDPLRTNNPLMAPSVWDQALKSNGFQDVLLADLHQSVFLSRATSVNPIISLPTQQNCPWLVIEPNHGTMGIELESLLQHLKSSGQSIELFSSNKLTTREAYSELLNGFDEISGIIYSKGLGRHESGTPESVTQFSESIVQDFLHFSQAVSDAAIAGSPKVREKVFVFVSGVISVGPKDTSPLFPFLSTIWGMTKALAREVSGTGLQVIGIDLDTLSAADLSKHGSELWNRKTPTGGHFALRNGIKYLPKLCRSCDKMQEPNLELPASERFQLTLPASGPITIDSLEIVAVTGAESPLAPHEMEVEVYFAGINFKDLLVAMDSFTEPNYYSFGGDFSGRVLRLGSQAAESYAVGDAVVGIAQDPYGTTAMAQLDWVSKKPNEISFAEAAALPAVGVTAYLSLITVGRLQAGQTVLVHSAAGGVGLSAVRLCQLFGARVIATVSSEAKREVLRGMGMSDIYNSRDLGWISSVEDEVDLVLNTLTGPGCIAASLKLLKPNGTFIEISKRNIWTKEEMARVRPDVTYHIVALEKIIYHDPQSYKPLLDQVCELYKAKNAIKNQVLLPITVRGYPLTQAVSAFKFMLSGKHIGKLALSPNAKNREPWGTVIEGTYIIAGGFGGLGLALTHWLLAQSPDVVIVLFGRSLPAVTPDWMVNNPRVHVLLGSVSNYSDCQLMINTIKSVPSFPAIKGVIHCAGTLDDSLYPTQSWEKYQRVFSPKVYGAWYLHLLTRSEPLVHFVVFSSAASYFGTAGQSSHVAASSFLDSLINYRRRNGYVGNSLLWGPWSEIGAAAGFKSSNLGPGMDFIDPRTGISVLDALVRENVQETLVVNFNWTKFIPANSNSLSPFWLQEIQALINTDERNENDGKGAGVDIFETLKPDGLEMSELEELVRLVVLGHTSRATGTPVSNIDQNEGFTNLGVDSLMALDLRNNLQKLLPRDDCKLSSTAIFDYQTVNNLSEYIIGLLSKSYALIRGSENKESSTVEMTTQRNGQEQLNSDSSCVAVVGMSCRFPGANSISEYWELLAKGKVTASTVPRERFVFNENEVKPKGKCYTSIGNFISSIDEFDHRFFNVSPKEAELMDPQHRLLLQSVWEALENAGIPPDELKNTRTAVFVGISGNDYWEILGNERGPYIATGNSGSCAAGRISYHFDLIGPSMSIDTACSSSLVAFHMAAQSLESGDADLAIVGGVNLMLTSSLFVNFCESNMLSKVGISRPFDEGSDGFVRGEGVGVVILRKVFPDGTGPLASLPNTPPLALVRSSTLNSDGYSSGYTAPNGQSQERLITEALSKAGVNAGQISYLEAHGTSTPLGDPIEMNALARVFGQGRDVETCGPLYVSSAKANVGHLEAASGLAGLIKVVLSIQNKTLAPHPTFNSLNPLISAHGFFEIPTQARAWCNERLVAGVSSFGFSGTNAHVILEGPSKLTVDPTSGGTLHQLLTISGPNETCLRKTIGNFVQYLESGKLTPESFPDVVYTTNTRRNHFKGARLGVVARNSSECVEKLKMALEGPINTKIVSGKVEKVVFLIGSLTTTKFPSSFCKDLFDTCPQFAKSVQTISDLVKSLKIQLDEGIESLVELMFGGSKRFGLGPRREEGSEIMLTRNLHQFTLGYALAKLWESEFGVVPHGVVGIGIGELAGAALTNMITLKDAVRLVAIFSSSAMGKEEIEVELEKVKCSVPKYSLISGVGGKKVQNLNDLKFLSVENLESGLEEGLVKAMRLSKGTTILIFSPSQPSYLDSKLYNCLPVVNLDEDEWLSALNTLSMLYESGVSISWRNFHQNGTFKQNVTSVPTHEFETTKHWYQQALKAVPAQTTKIQVSNTASKVHKYLGHLAFSSPRCSYYENSEFSFTDAFDLASLIDSALIGIIPALEGRAGVGLGIRLTEVDFKLMKSPPNSDFSVKWQTSIEKISSSNITVDCNYQVLGKEDDLAWYPAFSCKIQLVPQNSDSLGSAILQGFELSYANIIRDEKWATFKLLKDVLSSCSKNKAIQNIDQISLEMLPTGKLDTAGVVSVYTCYDSDKRLQVLAVSTPAGKPLIQIHGLEVVDEREINTKPRTQEPELFELFRESSNTVPKTVEQKSACRKAGTFLSLDQISLLFIARAFEKLKILNRIESAVKRIHVSDIINEFKILGKHEYLIQHIFRSLASLGYLSGNHEEGYTRNSASLEFPLLTEIEQRMPSLVKEVEESGYEVPLCRLLCQCASKLDLILTGAQDPIKLLFPTNTSSMVSAADVYKESSDLLEAYDIISLLFSSLKRPAGSRKYRILEVGGGTGGTTRHIYQTLKKQSIDFEYVFTDVSPYFFREAKLEFGKDERFTFSKFNVEVSPEPQGFPLKAFDIVVASNVLHATRNMKVTLDNVRALLKPSDGILVLCESSTRTLASDLTFGLLEGWWAFGSGEEKCPYRVDYPLLDGQGWDRTLRDTGFTDTIIIPGNQGVYIGRVGSGGQMDFHVSNTKESVQQDSIQNAHATADVCVPSRSLFDTLTDKESSAEDDVVAITGSLNELLSDITGIPVSDLTDKDVFSELGMDSLMTIDLQGRLEALLTSDLESLLSPQAAFDNPSTPDLTKYLISLKKSII